MPFGEYGLAMARKLMIAEFHVRELAGTLPAKPESDGLPPIALQAHFEAGGRAIVSMVDQLASGVAAALADVPANMPAVDRAYPERVIDRLEEGDLKDALSELFDDPRHQDLRSWRNRATHRFDEKAFHRGKWKVREPDGVAPYGGSREVVAYIGAMLEFGHDVIRSTDGIECLVQSFRARLT